MVSNTLKQALMMTFKHFKTKEENGQNVEPLGAFTQLHKQKNRNGCIFNKENQ